MKGKSIEYNIMTAKYDFTYKGEVLVSFNVSMDQRLSVFLDRTYFWLQSTLSVYRMPLVSGV